MEPLFWDRLQAIARARGIALAGLVADIDAARPSDANLSSAVRLFVLREALDRIPPGRPAPDPDTNGP